MKLVMNGKPRVVPDGSTVAQIVELLELPERGLAVALDGEVVPRSQWDLVLSDQASIEILTAVQGG